MSTRTEPALSIVTAVRDGEEHLEETIESIRGQSLDDWQWVIVDDGSSDRTAVLLAAAAQRDPRLEVLSRPPRGLVPALNDGLAHCRAAVVARIDADDVALPGRLAAQHAALAADPSLTVVDGRVELFGGRRNDGMKQYVAWVNEHDDHDSIAADLFVESPLVHPATCFRRAAVLACGGYRDGDFPEDYDLWLRLYRAGGRFAKLGMHVLLWRDRVHRLTRTDRRYRSAAFTALKQEHLWALEGDAIRSRRFGLWGAGRATRPWRQWLRAHCITPDLIVDTHPKRQGSRILDAPVVPPEHLEQHPVDYLLVTVSSPDSRREIRSILSAWGWHGDHGAHVRFV